MPPARYRMRHSSILPRRPRLGLILLAALTVLAACGPTVGSDDGQRQFAVQTAPFVPTSTAQREASPARQEGAATPDPARLYAARGTAPAAFFLIGGQLSLVSVDGAVSAVPLPGAMLASSLSPDGQQLAVLVRTDAPGATPAATPRGTRPSTAAAAGTATPRALSSVPLGMLSVVVIDANGQSVRHLDHLDQRLAASPDVAAAMSSDATLAGLALGPTSDDLVMVFSDGLLVRLGGDTATVIVGSGNFIAINDVRWSPKGDALVMLGKQVMAQPTGIYYAALRVDGIDPVLIGPGKDRAARAVGWLPTGRTLLYLAVTGAPSGRAIGDGQDLFGQSLSGTPPYLVAAAGIDGPSSGITAFNVSPDGQAIACVIDRASGDQMSFGSLWLASTEARGNLARVRLPGGTSVLDTAWTSVGLIVAVTGGPYGNASAFLQVMLDGTTGAVGSGASATPVATPA